MNNPPIHITICGEMECRGEGCRYCADDHRFIVGLMQFVLEELSISDEKLAKELATKWEEQRDG